MAVRCDAHKTRRSRGSRVSKPHGEEQPLQRCPAKRSLGYDREVHDVLIPFFLIAGGEILLGLVALRVLWWMLRGWQETLDDDSLPPDPDGPGGRPVLVLLNGQGAVHSESSRLRPAA